MELAVARAMLCKRGYCGQPESALGMSWTDTLKPNPPYAPKLYKSRRHHKKSSLPLASSSVHPCGDIRFFFTHISLKLLNKSANVLFEWSGATHYRPTSQLNDTTPRKIAKLDSSGCDRSKKAKSMAWLPNRKEREEKMAIQRMSWLRRPGFMGQMGRRDGGRWSQFSGARPHLMIVGRWGMMCFSMREK
jgi:hypothetical protein